jgi:hypothetical protein
MSDPQDPYGQHDPYGQSQQGYQQQYPQQGYQYSQQGYEQQYSGGYAEAAPRKPLDLAKIVFISAFVVVGLYLLAFLYGLSQSDQFGGGNLADRFFGGMPGLATGVFYGGVLLAVSVWLGKQKDD